MIGDAEQRQLAEIEMVLRRDDPAFVRHFDKWSLTRRRRHVGAILAILVVSAITAVARVLGDAGTAVIVLSVTGGIAIAFGLWRCRAQLSRRST
ncbi:hypothetical protein GCM10009744_18600 [Kribbella alba]|uniref:DUF3040 domain-containing protein n=1 Tax=Kribbella alba TaxID=190197 RepID=A0ABN2F4T9_9ACTN